MWKADANFTACVVLTDWSCPIIDWSSGLILEEEKYAGFGALIDDFDPGNGWTITKKNTLENQSQEMKRIFSRLDFRHQ